VQAVDSIANLWLFIMPESSFGSEHSQHVKMRVSYEKEMDGGMADNANEEKPLE
jgi:hypothetical protein